MRRRKLPMSIGVRFRAAAETTPMPQSTGTTVPFAPPPGLEGCNLLDHTNSTQVTQDIGPGSLPPSVPQEGPEVEAASELAAPPPPDIATSRPVVRGPSCPEQPPVPPPNFAPMAPPTAPPSVAPEVLAAQLASRTPKKRSTGEDGFPSDQDIRNFVAKWQFQENTYTYLKGLPGPVLQAVLPGFKASADTECVDAMLNKYARRILERMSDGDVDIDAFVELWAQINRNVSVRWRGSEKSSCPLGPIKSRWFPMEDTKRPVFGAEAERIGTRLDEATDEFLKETKSCRALQIPPGQDQLTAMEQTHLFSAVYSPCLFLPAVLQTITIFLNPASRGPVAAAPATPTSSGKVKKVKKVKAARRFEQSEIDEELPPELQDSEILGGSSDADLAVSDDSEEDAGTSRAAQMIKQAENAMAQTKPEKGDLNSNFQDGQIYLSQLPFSVTQEVLRADFEKFGEISRFFFHRTGRIPPSGRVDDSRVDVIPFDSKVLLVVWLAGVLASRADDVACALQKPLSKTKIHDNYVWFDGVSSVQFKETSHSITDGQPYGGVSSVGEGLDVMAGRHESSDVADDFNAGITGENALGLYTSSDSLPEELNFEVVGTLSLEFDTTTGESWTIDCHEIRLAQGHYFDMNNWWLAGTNCVRTDGRSLKCPCGDSNVSFEDRGAPSGASNSQAKQRQRTWDNKPAGTACIFYKDHEVADKVILLDNIDYKGRCIRVRRRQPRKPSSGKQVRPQFKPRGAKNKADAATPQKEEKVEVSGEVLQPGVGDFSRICGLKKNRYVAYLGINLQLEPELSWVAREMLACPMPPQAEMKVSKAGVCYFHDLINDYYTIEHPLTQRYLKVLERQRLDLLCLRTKPSVNGLLFSQPDMLFNKQFRNLQIPCQSCGVMQSTLKCNQCLMSFCQSCADALHKNALGPRTVDFG
eukprot:symbB.v1.2.024330.t1/scaffold2294.1/size83139/2